MDVALAFRWWTAALPMVYVRATELDADATLLAPELDADTGLQAVLEEIRCHAAVLFGLADDVEQASETMKAVPKVALVAPPADCTTSAGEAIASDSIDVVARAISMGDTHRHVSRHRFHVHRGCRGRGRNGGTPRSRGPERGAVLRLGHPAGIMPIAAKVHEKDGRLARRERHHSTNRAAHYGGRHPGAAERHGRQALVQGQLAGGALCESDPPVDPGPPRKR